MITEKHVAIDVDVDSPESAIQQVGQLMLENGLVDANYIQGMLNVYQEFGPYWVLTKGLAMPHARPEDGAIDSGLVVMTLKTPICFGHEEHDPVKVVVGMSATDKNKHVENIQKLVQVLSEKSQLEALSNVKSPSEVTAIMNK